MIEHHPLTKEFPEFRDQIHTLKEGDAHFARLMDEYEDVDKEIVRIETEQEARTDEYLEDRKKVRLSLKDKLYAALKAA
ncbi:MAG: YdcH family protein [Gammaproteobacteria bacterium]|jgi:uncharacterized protein YdcH (DUF465 family)